LSLFLQFLLQLPFSDLLLLLTVTFNVECELVGEGLGRWEKVVVVACLYYIYWVEKAIEEMGLKVPVDLDWVDELELGKRASVDGYGLVQLEL